MTGLLNRRGFQQAATRFADSTRSLRPWSVAMLDIDHFKAVNDSHGHSAGDEVIAGLARICSDSCRAGDAVARIGGEEFAFLLPVTTAAAAAQVAERIRSEVLDSRLSDSVPDLEVTVSIGVATRRSADETVTDALERADAALYEAKRSGRNRTVPAP